MEVSCPFAQDTGFCHFVPRTSEAETQLNQDSRVYMCSEHFVILYPRSLAQRHILGARYDTDQYMLVPALVL